MKYFDMAFKASLVFVILFFSALVLLIVLVNPSLSTNHFKEQAFVETKQEINLLLESKFSQSCLNGAAFELTGNFDMAKQYRKDFGECIDLVKRRYNQEKAK